MLELHVFACCLLYFHILVIHIEFYWQCSVSNQASQNTTENLPGHLTVDLRGETIWRWQPELSWDGGRLAKCHSLRQLNLSCTAHDIIHNLHYPNRSRVYIFIRLTYTVYYPIYLFICVTYTKQQLNKSWCFKRKMDEVSKRAVTFYIQNVSINQGFTKSIPVTLIILIIDKNR